MSSTELMAVFYDELIYRQSYFKRNNVQDSLLSCNSLHCLIVLPNWSHRLCRWCGNFFLPELLTPLKVPLCVCADDKMQQTHTEPIYTFSLNMQRARHWRPSESANGNGAIHTWWKDGIKTQGIDYRNTTVMSRPMLLEYQHMIINLNTIQQQKRFSSEF